MKPSLVLLCLLLTAIAVTHRALAQPDALSVPVTCCFNMVSKKVPKQRLKSYTRVSSPHCPQEAVIFRTKMNKEVCASPTEKWVKDSVKYLDKKLETLKA